MGAFLATLKKLATETVKKGIKDKAKGNNTCAAGCVTGCGLGCLGVVLIIVLIVMGIVGALQSVFDTVALFWKSITNGIYMDFVADNDERYLDAYYSVADFEDLTAQQYNFLFTNEHAQEIHADLISEIESYFDDSLMSYEAFKDFVSVVSEFEDYNQQVQCLRYLPLVTRQYSPQEFADILESFLSEEGYPYFENGSSTDAYINIADEYNSLSELYDNAETIDYSSKDGQMYQRFQNYINDIDILRTSTDAIELQAALDDVYDFFENFHTNGAQEAVTTHRILFGYLATVEDDYNWEFSDTQYSNKIIEGSYNISDTPDTELLEYKDGAVIYSLTASKMEDSSWLSPCSYEYEYGVSWQHVYATYVEWALESGELENPNETGDVKTDESGNIITYIDKDKLYEIAQGLLDFNSIVWYDNNSIEDIQAYLKKNANAIIEDFEQRINICLDEQMMSDLPKRVNYVSGSVLEDGGSRVSTSVTAVPKVIQSLFGMVQYVGEEEKVLDGVNVSLTPDKFAQENVRLIYGEGSDAKFDWEFYSQILLGAPKGEELSERIDSLNQKIEDGEDMEFYAKFEHDGYPYTISLASIILNPDGFGTGAYVPVDGEGAQVIWNFFIKQGVTEIGTAGIMGNLYQESHFAANNMQNRFEGTYNDETYTAAVDSGAYGNFINDRIGYGIAQFTYPALKSDLYYYANTRGTSIGDLEMQLNFLWETMNSAKYETQTLVSGLNSCSTPADAAVLFQNIYEKAGASAQMDNRIAYANFIYDQFVNTNSGSSIVGGNSGTVPVITSAFSAYATGQTGDYRTCISLSESQINAVLESLGNISRTRKSLIRGALQKVGRVPYYYGAGHSYALNAEAMDCSGFVGTMLYHYAGINWNGASTTAIVDGITYGSLSGGRICSVSELMPGDIIIRIGGNGNHAVMYIGINQYGYPMTIDETGAGAYDGNVLYQQKGTDYLSGGIYHYIHLNI